MIGAATMDLIDLTIVNVALPTIRRDLGASGAQLEWIVSAYMLAFAAALIVAGSFGDLLGRKRIFVGGIVVFGLASLGAGVARSPGQLIAARAVQGIAAAAMIPQLLGTFRAIFSGEERGKAFGLYGAILGVVEERRQYGRVAPLLRIRLLRVPAFSAGLLVQLAFSAGLQGFFLVFAVWLQTGRGFSPLTAGLTALAFSIGSFLLAGAAVPLARRHGRLILAGGGLLMALGAFGVLLGASHVGQVSNPWPVVPGLVVSGMGLSLLVIPLANVVLAAVPR